MAFVVLAAGVALAAVVFTFTLFALLLKIAVRLILFPLFLLKWILTSLVMIIVGPILLIVGLVFALAAGLLLAVPLLPLVVVGGLLWLIVTANRPRAVA